MNNIKCDVLIIGGGMVGLSIANQLVSNDITNSVIILDKEKKLGAHSSGRNSGVLHAGIYYQPNSIRAKICLSGAKRLSSWVEERRLELNHCGKLIVPQRTDLDSQLDILYQRGIKNGATVELIDEKELACIMPEARSSTGRALWSPNTKVVKPLSIINTLQKELSEKGIKILLNEKVWEPNPNKSEIKLSNGDIVSYGYLFNCAGLQADKIAHQFHIGKEYKLLPFKGTYWQIKKLSSIQPKCNLYPVPDLNVPFLGVHFTPSADLSQIVSIGPTAIPAFGRENYEGFNSLEPIMTLKNLTLLSKLYFRNHEGFRRYVHEQAFLSIPLLLIKSAQDLIPQISLDDIEPSKKIGIRAQLYNYNTNQLENDFICLHGEKSTHVLNAISPAFTASFALADLILDKSNLLSKSEPEP